MDATTTIHTGPGAIYFCSLVSGYTKSSVENTDPLLLSAFAGLATINIIALCLSLFIRGPTAHICLLGNTVANHLIIELSFLHQLQRIIARLHSTAAALLLLLAYV